jgi:hypothetical protein
MTAREATRASMPPLRPYQAEITRAILGRIARREGGSISVEIARQGGKNELSARAELYILLGHAARGGAIVKCAPTFIPQARISLHRLRDRARDAGLGGMFDQQGASIRCGRAQAHFLSAEPSANVVGHTADLLLEVDEAQDVDVEKFDRDFRPMAASTNAPVIYYGTPWGPDTLLAQAAARHRETERAGGPRRHFRFDWEAVAAVNPAYGRFVEEERARLGERHPLFRTQYCLEVLHQADRLFDAATLAQLVGAHDRMREPRAGERYVAGLDLAGPELAGGAAAGGRDRDWSVLTIARVTPGEHAPLIEVVEHQAWRGEATEPLIERLADRLRRIWRIRRLVVDATGLGGPLADLLATRLGRTTVEPVTFSVERKSALGFALLAAAHSGRLRLYRQDGSAEYVACRRQLELARVAYSNGKTMRFDVDPARDHDDYLVSLALAVHAAGAVSAPRIARGHGGEAETTRRDPRQQSARSAVKGVTP